MRLIDADALINRIVFHKDWSSDEKEAFEDVINEEPSVELERKTGCLTEDEIKAIRIHMNAFKERLCNQHRWKEAEEYQQIVDKLDVMLPQSEQRWIPCSERLPEDGERVLATHLGGINPDRQVIEHIYENGEFILGWDMDMNIDSPTFGQRYMGNIIAWMPLPKPYMEEEE